MEFKGFLVKRALIRSPAGIALLFPVGILIIMAAMRVIGLISGTSTDGIDAALVEITGPSPDSSFKLLRFSTFPYPRGVRERLFRLGTSGTVGELCHINFYIGELFAEAAQKISRQAGYKMGEIDLIGSHGQTICHLPIGKKEGKYKVRSTLQIAEPSVIAQRTGVTTIADFRPRDIAAGGEGAPLTPYLHYRLFHHTRKSRIIVNIGGISNMTYLPAGKGPEAVLAFDTGPGNMLMDGLVYHKTRGRSRMDRGGKLARKGEAHQGLLNQLLRHPFIRRRPPKSTGREVFGAPLVTEILKKATGIRLSTEDLLATVTEFTVQTIAENYRRFILPKGNSSEMVVGGGGTRNETLMRSLEKAVAPLRVMPFEDYGLDSKAIEAMAFALLAYETIHGVPSNVPSATGAERTVVMGKIIPGDSGQRFTL